MQKYIYWRDDQMYFGYFEAYPDCWTQGETRGELEENLIDIYNPRKHRMRMPKNIQ